MKRKFAHSLISLASATLMIASAFAGCSTPTYRCSRDDQCTSSGELPKCIIEQPMSTGVCAEANLQCVSGYRYSRSAPNAGMCVPAVLDAGVDAGQDVVSTDMPTVGLDVLGTDADVPNMTPDQQPVDGGVATECDTDPGRPNCSCILQVRPPAMPILAGPLGVCEIRVIRPLSQRLSPGRSVRFKVDLGSSVSNPRVGIVSIRANLAPMNLALPLTVMAGSGSNTFTETEASTYAIRWRITGECNGRQISTPDTTLALPRPYRVADCVAGPAGCSSPLEPIAANTDLDGDGRSDLVVGQQKLITVSTATNLGAAVTTEVCLETSSDRLGRNIEAVGDLDGDGVSDFLLSSCIVSDPSASCNDVAIAYGGGASGISSVRMLSPFSALAGLVDCRRGATLAAGSDFNQDGYADALVGSPCSNGGMLHVVLGSPSRASEIRLLQMSGAPLVAVAAEPMFARGISMIGRQNNGTELATLVKNEIIAKGAKRVAVMTLPDSATTPPPELSNWALNWLPPSNGPRCT